MGTSNSISLGALRQQTRQRADIENNPAFTDAELNTYISQSYKELADVLVGATDNNYFFAVPYLFTTSNNQYYPLPDGSPNFINSVGSTAQAVYKVLGVDLQNNASPTMFTSLKRFNFIERNRQLYPNTATTFANNTNLRYGIQGDQLFLTPIPMTGQTMRLWYIPSPNSIQYMLPCQLTLGSNTLNLTDTTGLTAGMNVYGTGIVPNSVVSSVGSTSLVINTNALASNNSAILSFWIDNSLINGVNGFEEYIIIDAAIKCQIKQEGDISGLENQKAQMLMRIQAISEGRDQGQAFTTSDVMGMNGPYGSYDGGYGNGYGYGDW